MPKHCSPFIICQGIDEVIAGVTKCGPKRVEQRYQFTGFGKIALTHVMRLDDMARAH